MKVSTQTSLIAAAIAVGLGLLAAPVVQADSCYELKKMHSMKTGYGVTEYGHTTETLFPTTTTQTVIVERPVVLENRCIERPIILENRTVERQVITERVPVYITKKRVSYKPVRRHKVRHVAHRSQLNRKVISSHTTINRTTEKAIVVERPVVIEQNRYIDRPVFVDRVVEKPVYINRTVERPVYINRTVTRPVMIERRVVSRPVVIERPTMIERRVIEHPVIIEKKKRHLLNLHIL